MPPETVAAAEAEAALYGDDLAPPAAKAAVAGPRPGATAGVTAWPEADSAPAAEDPPAVESSAPPEPAGEIEAEEPPAAEPPEAQAAEATPAETPEPEAVATQDTPEIGDEPAVEAVAEPPQAPPRRELDDAVLSILRQEAEHEAEVRRIEAQRASSRRAEAETEMQTQPELGVDTPPAAALTPAQKRLAMLRGEDLDEEPEPDRPAARLVARRDLLPDVEEINSTLQPGDSDHDPESEIDALPDLTRGGGFRTGFLLALFLLLVATTIYLTASSISALVPALKGPLDSYVIFVDNLRLWLNTMMDSATSALTSQE